VPFWVKDIKSQLLEAFLAHEHGEWIFRGPDGTSSASDVRHAWGAFHMDKAGLEIEIGFGDFEHSAASLFAFSATFEICRDDRLLAPTLRGLRRLATGPLPRTPNDWDSRGCAASARRACRASASLERSLRSIARANAHCQREGIGDQRLDGAHDDLVGHLHRSARTFVDRRELHDWAGRQFSSLGSNRSNAAALTTPD
jgi:hypothetical protein